MSTDYRALCAELLAALALFVDSDGDSSYISDDEKEAQDHIKDARALITRARAALAQPDPVGPTDEELLALAVKQLIVASDGTNPWQEDADISDEVVEYARAVFARWGHPTPQPIPVSERLPGPEDCWPEGHGGVGCCWQWEPDINGHEPLGSWKLQHRDWASDGEVTHWLPATALPLPPTT